ncbi:MAG: hypothetical protein AAF501_06125 [Pseudomonadota bacterium]
MDINISYRLPDEGPGSGPVRVGWLLSDERSGVIYDAPARLRSVEMNKRHAKSASRCPAVINLESRYFEVKCPFDLHLRFVRDTDGKPALRNMLSDMSPVRAKKLNSLLYVTSEAEWRYPDRPTIQLSLPYIFIADEPVYMSQVSPFLHYRADPWPGTLFGGRFPINIWPRPLMWAFEWHDISRDLVLSRGEPLFYCTFETVPQDRPVQLVEAERTPELDAYLEHISAAVNFVNQTFSLFKTAEERRPATLVRPRSR